MKKLIRKGEKDKPEVNFNPISGILIIGGSSLPENVLDVYNPILEWLTEYVSNPGAETKVIFSFEYLNTASTNMVARMAEKIYKLNDTGKSVHVTWHYYTGDYDMKDLGTELFLEGGIDCDIVERHFS